MIGEGALSDEVTEFLGGGRRSVTLMLNDDEKRALEKVLDPESEMGRFLRDARDEDVTTLREGLELVRATRTVGRFVKWLILSVVGVFVGTVMLGETLMRFLSWFRGGSP